MIISSLVMLLLAKGAGPDVSACTQRGSDITYCLSMTEDVEQIAKIHSIAMSRVKPKQVFDEGNPPFFVEAQSAGRLAGKTSEALLLSYASSKDRRTRIFGVSALYYLTSLLRHGFVRDELTDHKRFAEVWPAVRPVCTEALRDREAVTVRAGVECLAESGDPEVAPALANFVATSGSSFLREQALHGLRELPVDSKNKNAMKALVDLLEKKGDDRTVAAQARDICKVVARYAEPSDAWARPAQTAFPKECAMLGESGAPAGEVE